MKSKSLIKLGLIGFLLFPRIAQAEAKSNSFLKNFEVGIGPTYTVPFKKSGEDYIRQVNDDFRTGKYTWDIPMPWKKIERPKSNEVGGKGSFLVKLKSGKIKNPRVGVFIGYSGSSSTSNYNQNYENVYDPFIKKFGDFKFEREEDIHTSTLSFGPEVKVGLTDKLDFSTTLGVDFYKVKGNVDYTKRTMYSWYPKEHVEGRKADYEGNGTGFSVEGGLDCKILKNMSVGAAFGYRTGKVQTKGKEVKTSSTNPGMSWTRDYSPKLNFNSTYIEGSVEVTF